MTHKFLDEDIELIEFNIKKADEIQNIMLGEGTVVGGEASVNMKSFKEAMYKTIEYGTAGSKFNKGFILDLPASKSGEVQKLYDAIQKLNGQ